MQTLPNSCCYFLRDRNNVTCVLMISNKWYLFSLEYRSEQKEVVLSGLGVKFKLPEPSLCSNELTISSFANHTKPCKDVYIAPIQF